MFARLLKKEISDKVTSRIVTATMDDLATETFSLIFLRLKKAIPNATLIDLLNYEEDNLLDLLGPLPPQVFSNFKTWLLSDVLNEDEYYSILLQKNISHDIFVSANKRYLRSLNISNRAKHLVGDKTIAEILSISCNKLKTIPSMGTMTANDIILNVTNYISASLENTYPISNDHDRIIDTKLLLFTSCNNINLSKEDWIIISDTIYNATSYNFTEKRVIDLVRPTCLHIDSLQFLHSSTTATKSSSFPILGSISICLKVAGSCPFNRDFRSNRKSKIFVLQFGQCIKSPILAPKFKVISEDDLYEIFAFFKADKS